MKAALPSGDPAESSFADRFWRRETSTGASVMRLEHADQPAFRELADSQPTLCWLADANGYITWYNRRWHDYCGTTPEEMEGWGWTSVHDPNVLPEVLARWTASIASGEPFEMVFPLRGADGVYRPFLTRIVPTRDEAGAVRSWIGNNIDISAQTNAEEELRHSRVALEEANQELAQRQAFLTSILASSTDCIKVLDLEGRLTWMSDGGQTLMEVSDFNQIAGCPWPAFWEGTGREEAARALEAAKAGASASFVGPADTMKGASKQWHVAVSPIMGPDGCPERILSVSRDISALQKSEQEREKAEEQLRLLNGELSHRLKNVLTVVQSIVQQTLRRATDMGAASDDLTARLTALAGAADLLTASSWSSADLGELARRTLAPHGLLGERIRVDGPALKLLPQVLLAFGLAFHELATNAVKYGALSSEAGHVTLEWRVIDAESAGARFVMRWQEEGGPAVQPPTQRGFGSSLIERSLRSYCNAEVTGDYRPDGYVLSMDAGLECVVE